MFKQEDFQFIVSIKTNSTVAPRVVKGKEVEHIPIIYFIQFHDDVIDALKKADWFFSVPWQVAQGSPLIFTFYLALRSLKVTIDSILVDDIKKRIAFDGSAKRFVADLREELEVFYRNTSKNNTNFEFNLCGYFIRFSSNENGELTIFVKCDEKEMITTAGAKYAGKHSAPTLPNPIRRSRIEALSVKALDHKTDVERTLNYLNTRIVAPETKRYLKYRVLSFGGLQHVISAYSTDSEIKWLAQELQQFIETSLTVTIDTLNELKGQLSKLRFGSYEISDELFMEYYNYLGNVGLCSDIGAFFEIVKSYRSKKYRLWVERRFHEMSEI